MTHINNVKALQQAIETEQDLKFTSFTGANLCGADLSNLDLRWCRFEEANLAGCNFHGSNLDGSILDRANLTATNFVDANLANTSLKSVSARGVIFSGTNLSDAKMNGIYAWGGEFSYIKAYGSVLRDATLYHCDFHEAKMWRVDLDGALLDGSNFALVTMNESRATNARFKGVLFYSSNLGYNDFEDSNFKRANILYTDFEYSNLRHTIFHLANGYKINIENAYIEGSDLTGAVFRECKLNGAHAQEVLIGENTLLPEYRLTEDHRLLDPE